MSETRTVDVLDGSGNKSGSAELPAAFFDTQTNIPLIHQVVTAQLAAARQGSHSTKTRAEVRGGGRKPYRQKGTGRARQGSIRAPQYAGGGIAHGPHPHGYAQRTPKKMVAAALRGALSDRAREGRIHVVSELVSGEAPSTQTALASLKAASSTEKVLVVIGRDEDVTWLSLRNVRTVHAIAVDQLNTYDVLVNDEVIFTENALVTFVNGPSAGKSAKGAARESEVVAPVESEAVLRPSVDAETEAVAPVDAETEAVASVDAETEAVASAETAEEVVETAEDEESG